MKDSAKLLYFDPAEANIPTPAADAPNGEPVLSAEVALAELVSILRASGLNPVTQLSGYLITEDPTYLPEGTEARALARHVGRDRLLEVLIELYIKSSRKETDA